MAEIQTEIFSTVIGKSERYYRYVDDVLVDEKAGIDPQAVLNELNAVLWVIQLTIEEENDKLPLPDSTLMKNLHHKKRIH